MANLRWFKITLPRDMTLDQVVAVVRPLAYRPGSWLGGTPVAVLETWSNAGDISWRLGLDASIASNTPAQLATHVPRLGIHPLKDDVRPALTLGADLIVDGLVAPLRTELAGSVSAALLGAMQRIEKSEVAVLQWIIGPSRRRQSPPEPFDLKHALGFSARRKADPADVRLFAAKTSESLYACRGRIAVRAKSSARAAALVHMLADSLKLANNTRSGVRLGAVNGWRATELVNASSKLTWSALLNATELATLLAWPVTENVGDGLSLVGGHINEAPAKLLVSAGQVFGHAGDRVLGESMHAGQYGQLVTMPARTALHHVAVTGPTGSGKSTLLVSWVLADAAAGRGAIVVEPRGDLVGDILARFPAHRCDDLIVVQPGGTRPVGLNPLAGPPGQAERRADQIVGLLKAMHGDALGPRTTDLALHALITVARSSDGTLADVPVLLTNASFRRQILAVVSDPLVLAPFWAGFDALSDGERQQVIAPLMNKLRSFLSRSAVRHMLGQATPLFDIEDIFRKRRVVLVALNEGVIGTEAVNLIGSLILMQFWQATQRRASVASNQRHPVMAVIDEYQRFMNLPGVDYGDVLAQSRGLGVSWTLAHQHLDQLSSAMQAATFANARNRVVFHPAPADARPLAAALGGGLTGDDLRRLGAYEACASLLIDGEPSRPFSVRTQPLPPWTSDPDALRDESANRYGADGAALDQALISRWQGPAGGQSSPIGGKRRTP